MLRRCLALFILIALLVFPPASTSAANKPNIVLITMDAVRADRMGFLGSKAKITPNLDGIAQQSMVFEQAYAQSPLTIASHATILTGTYPQTHKAGEFGTMLSANAPLIPDILRARGYHTAAFAGSISLDPKNGFAPGFDRGFDFYDAGFRQPEAGRNVNSITSRSGMQVVTRANAWLAHNPQSPFFVWVHLIDAHESRGAAYNTAVNAEDAAAGKLIAALLAAKLYDDTLIVVAADHGQSLGSHGEETHGIFLYDETVHVPLLLKLPQGQSDGKRIRARVRLVDVAPTVLEVAGVPVPSEMQGQSLLRIAKASSSTDQPAYAISDFPQKGFGWSVLESWRAGKYLYIRAPKPELYDLSADPGATHNLAQSSKAILDTMAAQLDTFSRRISDEGGKTSDAGLSSSEVQKLASLGYVGLQKTASPINAATGVDPKDEIATANRVLSALAAVNEGKPEKAIAALQPSMTAASNMYLAQYVMGIAFARQQRYAQSIEYLHQAIQLQPDSVWAHYAMGSSLFKAGDYKTAAVHLEIAANRLPNFTTAHFLLAQAYEKLGRAEDANREGSRARQLEAAKP